MWPCCMCLAVDVLFYGTVQAMVSKAQLLTDAVAQLKAAGYEEVCTHLERSCLPLTSTQSASNMNMVSLHA